VTNQSDPAVRREQLLVDLIDKFGIAEFPVGCGRFLEIHAFFDQAPQLVAKGVLEGDFPGGLRSPNRGQRAEHGAPQLVEKVPHGGLLPSGEAAVVGSHPSIPLLISELRHQDADVPGVLRRMQTDTQNLLLQRGKRSVGNWKQLGGEREFSHHQSDFILRDGRGSLDPGRGQEPRARIRTGMQG
jgi:hypothetical protein